MIEVIRDWVISTGYKCSTISMYDRLCTVYVFDVICIWEHDNIIRVKNLNTSVVAALHIGSPDFFNDLNDIINSVI